MKVLRDALLAVMLFGTEGSVSSALPPDRPTLVSATYWGGSLDEDFAAVAVDAAGNAYVAGTTASSDFPKTVSTLPALGTTDVFVSKFDAAGALVFSTVFGGSAFDRVSGIAVDADGNIIVVGDTISSDFPVVNAIQPAFHPAFCGEFGGTCSDGFVAKLDPTGHSLLFSTYLGTMTADSALDVTVDAAGNIYIAGATGAPTFEGATPLRQFGGTRDAFVAKIPPGGGTFTYFTYLGGTFEESGNGIAVDTAGNAYVTGVTSSQNYPTLNPIQAAPENYSESAFVTKLDATGVLAYSTYLSGRDRDVGVDIAVDMSGRAHVVGITWSTNFPTANPRQPFLRGANDVFVAKLTAAGSGFEYSTYLGGNDREEPVSFLDFTPMLDVTIDASGNAYVSGATQSSDFPAVFALRPFGGGVCVTFPFFEATPCPDAFVSKLDVEGRVVFSTPIGGSRDDRGKGVAVAHDGTVYVTGITESPDFPLNTPIQPSLSGSSDAFIAKISTAPPACQLPSPVHLSPRGGIFDQQPTFSWEPVDGADAYAVMLSGIVPFLLTGTPPIHVLGTTQNRSFTPAEPLPAGDYGWVVVAWNSTCGLGQTGRGVQFTLPGTCPAPSAIPVSPVGGALVDNPIRLEWNVDGPSIATIPVVVILHSNGRFVAQYPTESQTFTVPLTLSRGDYVWFVVTWNSTCGATVSAVAPFTNSGRVVP